MLNDVTSVNLSVDVTNNSLNQTKMFVVGTLLPYVEKTALFFS